MPIPNNETRYFQLQIRTDSVTGPVKITSNVITVVDSLQAFVIATGGTEYINDGFKTHVFTSSNNFVISGLGLPANRNLYYEVIAGGGAGGYSTGSSGTAGGGGAGGFLRGNVTLSTTGTFAMVVGAGRTGSLWSPGGRGNDSSILSNAYVATGGGNGGRYEPTGTAGSPGGSGGGAALFASAGSGTTGQGTAGRGAATDTPYFGGGGGGAGQGGGTAMEGGNGLISVSITNIPAQAQPGFGTPGIPSTGKWFAGGGGGGYGQGGYGGGGAPNGGSGTVNTGGGGSALGVAGSVGGGGGSGIVIVRYPYTVETYRVSSDSTFPNNIADGSNINLTLNTINVSNATVLYYTTNGNVTSSDFIGGNTGSFTILNSNASFRLAIANNIVSGNNTKNFTLELRKGSTSGQIVYNANSWIIQTSQGAFTRATGGNQVVTANGYTIHTFLSSNTFAVSSVGSLYGNIDILSVAGGGGGGGYNYFVGAGGAGGLISRSLATSATPSTITIGGGGSGKSTAGNGTNTTITGGITLTAVGGGGAGWYNSGSGAGAGNGGSGGGFASGGGGGTFGTGYGYPSPTQQGYPGVSGPGWDGGGGGGAGGVGTISAGGPGIAIPWAPPTTGTPGPTPGRWFAGGGSAQNNSSWTAGGAGGGGSGARYGNGNPPSPGVLAESGTVNTGGGGGGGGLGATADSTIGGSGIVIIRYKSKDNN